MCQIIAESAFLWYNVHSVNIIPAHTGFCARRRTPGAKSLRRLHLHVRPHVILQNQEKTFEKSSVLFRRRNPAEPIYDFRLVLSGYDPGRQTGKPVLLAGAKRRRDFDCRTSKRRTPRGVPPPRFLLF